MIEKMISQLMVLAILILINAFFAASEIAFISLNDAKIAKLAKDGDKKAKRISKMLKEPSKFLATIQIGVTLAGFLMSAFASETFADKLAPVLQNWVSWEYGVLKNISIVLITLILSYITLVFGELVPKRLAMKNYEKISYMAIGPIRGIYVFALPFVNILTWSTNIISRLFGVTAEDEEQVTEEEIRMMIDVGEENGNIDEAEKEMINNIFEFNDKSVSDIMTHRMDVVAIDVKSDIDEVMANIEEHNYSRIPVYEESIDEIVGILNTKDLFKYIKGNKKVKVKTIMREPYFVSENKMIDELFRELQKNKNQMAVVLDEYGGTSGIVTMEDILEEIVGNIFDEYDEIENEYEKIDENTFLLSGSLPIYELEKILETKIEEGDYDTLSGYLIELLGRIPDDDENPIIETEKVTYKIEEYEDKRIIWVKACKEGIQDESRETSE